MFRTTMFSAFVLGLIAMDSGATPAAASSSQVFGNRKEQIFARYHPVNSPGTTMYRPPSKKKPL
jgi:hypothetical protein